jgi:hypothetical protein
LTWRQVGVAVLSLLLPLAHVSAQPMSSGALEAGGAEPTAAGAQVSKPRKKARAEAPHHRKTATRRRASHDAGVEERPAPASATPRSDNTARTGGAERVRATEPGKAVRKKKARHEMAERRMKRTPRPKKKSAYDLLMEGMHAAAPEETRAEASNTPVRKLVIRVQGRDTPFVLSPLTGEGGFDTEQLAVAKRAFGAWARGPTPHPRVLDLVYAATLYFDVPYVYLISGIRQDRGGSRHSHGLAADVVFPGVVDDDLAAFFRAQGFVGVGTYPRSGFVHVDTRDKSYFWVDHSAPGRRGRVVTVRAEEARAVDEAAVARGNDGFVNPPRLQRALRVRAVRKRHVREGRRAAVETSAPPPESKAAEGGH